MIERLAMWIKWHPITYPVLRIEWRYRPLPGWRWAVERIDQAHDERERK